MSILESLYEKHRTNKLWHGYASFYEKLFNDIKDNKLNFLEIGIDQGASMFAWQEYFKNSSIYGIDIVIPECIKNQSKIKYSIADQSNINQLMNTLKIWEYPKFDIIIDDGGHYVSQQRISIETLWSSLKSGGYYIIEDLHTNIKNMQIIHPHLNKNSKHIDEIPTIHDKIYNIMSGLKNEFNIRVSEIDEIYYFNTPNKLSLSCAFKKV